MRLHGSTAPAFWHRVGFYGCLATTVAALAAYLPTPQAHKWDRIWLWSAASTVVAILLRVSIGRHRPAVVLQGWPVLAIAQLGTLVAIDRVAASALVGALYLVCLFTGLTLPPRQAWWATGPCAAVLFSTLSLPASVTIVRVVVATAVLVAVCEIPAVLLDRVHAQEGRRQHGQVRLRARRGELRTGPDRRRPVERYERPAQPRVSACERVTDRNLALVDQATPDQRDTSSPPR